MFGLTTPDKRADTWVTWPPCLQTGADCSGENPFVVVFVVFVINSYHCYFLCFCCLLCWVAIKSPDNLPGRWQTRDNSTHIFPLSHRSRFSRLDLFLWLEISSIMSVVRSLGKIAPSTSALFLCDMQVVLTKKKPFQRVNRFPGEVPPNDLSLWRGGSKQCAGSRCRCSHGNAHCCHRAVSKVSLSLSCSLWPKSLWSSLPFFRGLGPTVPELELEKFGVKVQIPPRNVVISYKGKDYKSVLATQHRD